MEFNHISVMLNQAVDGLNVKPDGIYVDGTVGRGGHSALIASRLTTGKLIALDQDPDAIEVASKKLLEYKCAKVVKANFRDVKAILKEQGINGADGILLDLGVSSHQLDQIDRGFSYNGDARLDMRMSQSGMSAFELVNTFSEGEIARILFEYGEEQFARRIAQNIVAARSKEPIATTFQLVEIIKASIPAAKKREKNPCKKTFQAIRIAVNEELDSLSEGLDSAFECLNGGGRLSIITFHSLEDRMVKQRFLSWCKGCTCPSKFPVCICGNTPKAKLAFKKPIIASDDEIINNRRSKSAKLRVIEKIQ